MGSKNFRRREPRKLKKGTKKTDITTFVPQTEVEVIKKGKKTSNSSEE